jgi:hypothetical protein
MVVGAVFCNLMVSQWDRSDSPGIDENLILVVLSSVRKVVGDSLEIMYLFMLSWLRFSF